MLIDGELCMGVMLIDRELCKCVMLIDGGLCMGVMLIDGELCKCVMLSDGQLRVTYVFVAADLIRFCSACKLLLQQCEEDPAGQLQPLVRFDCMLPKKKNCGKIQDVAYIIYNEDQFIRTMMLSV